MGAAAMMQRITEVSPHFKARIAGRYLAEPQNATKKTSGG
jgi:hypothetical protein